MRRRSFLAPLAALAMAAVAVIPAPAQAASSSYPLYNSFMQGGPSTPWPNSTFVPQGLTKLGENYLVISYHDASGNNKSRLAVVNRITGAQTATYTLNTYGHVGGLATTPSTPDAPAALWVSQPDSSDPTKDKLWKYPLPSTSGSGTLTATAGYTVAASSYAFGQGTTVWVGEFKKGWQASDGCPAYNDTERQKMYQYDVSSGTPTPISSHTTITPARVQGVTVTNSTVVWSTSCGRHNDSQLIYGPALTNYTSNSAAFKAVLAPVLSEGMVIADNKQQIVFESGSSEYSDADNRQYRINSQYAALP